MMQHIVLYRLRDPEDGASLGSVLSILAAIDGVEALHHGANSNPLCLAGDWDYGLHVEFADSKALGRYMVDPRHVAVVPIVESLTSSLLVYGITTGEATS